MTSVILLLACTDPTPPKIVADGVPPPAEIVTAIPPAAPEKVAPAPEPYGETAAWDCAVCVAAKQGKDFHVAPKGAAALFDGNPSTPWCAKSTDATLHFRFPKPVDLYQIEVLGGDFSSSAALQQHGRVQTLRVSAGSSQASIHLQDPIGVERKMAVALPAIGDAHLKAVTDLDLSVESTYAGPSGDVCISEVTLVVLTAEARP